MSYTFFQLGGTCPPMSIAWGQMSSYAIFHRGHMSGGGGGEGNVLHSGNSITLR